MSTVPAAQPLAALPALPACTPAATPIVRELDASWIDQMLILQEAAGDNQIVPRDRKWLENLLSEGHKVLGITDENGDLVAQAILRLNVDKPKGLNHLFNDEARACISCVLVHPSQRGRKLMGYLMTACLESAARNGQQDIHARVRLGNNASLKNFLIKDFTVVAIGPSPEAPHPMVHTLRRQL